MNTVLRRRTWAGVVGLTVVVGIACCSGGCRPSSFSVAAQEADATLPLQTGWRVAGGPILRAGEARAQGLWNDPSVLMAGSQYVMYATSSTKEMFKPPVAPFRFVSDDGIRWTLNPPTPLLVPSESGFVSTETPSVVVFNGKHHMFYTGLYKARVDVGSMAVGHAVSDDGKTWTADPRGGVLKATGNPSDWNGFLVAEPGAVVFHDRIYLYFTALSARPGGNPPQRHVIGLTTTVDGKTFDAPRPVLEQAEIYPPGSGFAGYSTPSAAVRNGSVYLFYDVVIGKPEWKQVALHDAVSSDGERFTQARMALSNRGQASWTSSEIRSPSVLFEGDKVRMWFAGHGDVRSLIRALQRGQTSDQFGIGLAETDTSLLDRGLDRTAQPTSRGRSRDR